MILFLSLLLVTTGLAETSDTGGSSSSASLPSPGGSAGSDGGDEVAMADVTEDGTDVGTPEMGGSGEQPRAPTELPEVTGPLDPSLLKTPAVQFASPAPTEVEGHYQGVVYVAPTATPTAKVTPAGPVDPSSLEAPAVEIPAGPVDPSTLEAPIVADTEFATPAPTEVEAHYHGEVYVAPTAIPTAKVTPAGPVEPSSLEAPKIKFASPAPTLLITEPVGASVLDVAPTATPTFQDTPAGPVDPSSLEAPIVDSIPSGPVEPTVDSQTPEFATPAPIEMIQTEAATHSTAAQTDAGLNGVVYVPPTAWPTAKVTPSGPVDPSSLEAPVAGPITPAGPLDPSLLDKSAAVENVAKPDSALDTTLFEAYMQQLAAIWHGDSGCFTSLVNTIATVESCAELRTANPCVVEFADAFDSLAESICVAVGPRYFADMNMKRWFPSSLAAASAFGSEWPAQGRTDHHEQQHGEAKIVALAGRDQQQREVDVVAPGGVHAGSSSSGRSADGSDAVVEGSS